MHNIPRVKKHSVYLILSLGHLNHLKKNEEEENRRSTSVNRTKKKKNRLLILLNGIQKRESSWLSDILVIDREWYICNLLIYTCVLCKVIETWFGYKYDFCPLRTCTGTDVYPYGCLFYSPYGCSSLLPLRMFTLTDVLKWMNLSPYGCYTNTLTDVLKSSLRMF